MTDPGLEGRDAGAPPPPPVAYPYGPPVPDPQAQPTYPYAPAVDPGQLAPKPDWRVARFSAVPLILRFALWGLVIAGSLATLLALVTIIGVALVPWLSPFSAAAGALGGLGAGGAVVLALHLGRRSPPAGVIVALASAGGILVVYGVLGLVFLGFDGVVISAIGIAPAFLGAFTSLLTIRGEAGAVARRAPDDRGARIASWWVFAAVSGAIIGILGQASRLGSDVTAEDDNAIATIVIVLLAASAVAAVIGALGYRGRTGYGAPVALAIVVVVLAVIGVLVALYPFLEPDLL